jgi:hypothetical protein
MSRIYLGRRRSDAQWEPFRPTAKPTKESHGAKYFIAEGPFATVAEAIQRLEYRRASAGLPALAGDEGGSDAR